MILGQPVTLKPMTPGLHLRKEDGSILAVEGETVIATSYWLRRLNEGDVLEVIPEPLKTKG
jgi:hypothetical protein